MLQTGGLDGHIYGLPRTCETMTLFYNKTLFDKNAWQPPKTLAEVQALAAAMMQKGITPFGAGNADWRGANEWYVTLVLNDDAGPDNVYKALTGKLRWTTRCSCIRSSCCVTGTRRAGSARTTSR